MGMFDTFWGHQMVPEDLYSAWLKNCGSSMELKTYSSAVRTTTTGNNSTHACTAVRSRER